MPPLATYLPSYFEIKINTDLDLKSLATIPKKEQGLYYHEYLHFLQDLTTTYGVLKTWNAYDRLRQLIHFVQIEDKIVPLPLQNSSQEEQQKFIDFLHAQAGSFKVGIWPSIDEKFVIKGFTATDDPLINELIPDTDAKHVDIILSQENYPDRLYRFGESAISEGMVYIAESKFFQIEQPPKYPYLVAAHFAKFIYPPIGDVQEFLFALCDISLMHPLPGWAFVRLLEEMSKQNFQAAKGEEVIDFGYKLFDKWGWKIENQINKAVEGILGVTDEMYAHEYFISTIQWFQTIIVRGKTLRLEKPYFFLNIFRDGVALGEHLTLAWINVGGPHCINAKGERTMKVPQGLEKIESQVHPQHLRVAWQFNQLLMNATIPCKLKTICQASENKELVDDRCDKGPWERVNDQMACPFAAAWAIYGFRDKTFVIDGKEVITTAK